MAGDAGRVETLLGRRAECAHLDHLVSEVAAGASRVLVVRGDAGAGKSALLGYVANRVTGWRVTSVVGVQSEMELAFSGLHQLCTPLLGHLDAIPGPQSDALATLFGMGSGPAPDRFVIGLATLSLLAEAAERQPLLCLIDDGQWLDQPTSQTLAFVARRLLAERIAIVCAARTGVGDDLLAGSPESTLHGLGDDDARSLLLANMHAPMDESVCDRIIAESRGNPLALLELPRSWTAMDLAGGFGLPAHDSIASRIEESYLRRLRLLPTDTQLLVLTAAAEPLGDPALLTEAADALGITVAAAAPAVDQGLLRIRQRVEFAHPLVRSATYYAAAEADRHRAHSALANVTDAGADPDRRAWHRAQAARWPDDEVATELERSAHRAQARGGLPAAAAFLTRSAELTPNASQRVERALQAALANVQAGAFGTARRLLTIARDAPLDEPQQARVDLLEGQLALASSRGNDAAALLLAAAKRLEPIDSNLARDTYLNAFAASLFAARLAEAIDTATVAKAAGATTLPTAEQATSADLLLQAYCAITEDYPAAARECSTALRRLCNDKLSSAADMRWLRHGVVLALELWDDTNAYTLAKHHVESARASGALSELALALSSAIPVLVFCGEIRAAASAVAEAESVQLATGIDAAPYGTLILKAWQGDDVEPTQSLIEDTLRAVTARGEGIGITVSEYSRATLCNALGRYDEALAAATHATEDPREMVAYNWGLAELAEAGARTGHVDIAEDAVNRISVKAKASGTHWALGMQARSRALVSDDSVAESSYRTAIDHLSQTRIESELARAHLLYGEWLRRTNRRSEARRELNTAHEFFTSRGMEAFAERTRRELVASGAAIRKRTANTRGDLTPQEAQIAALARQGYSNSEIGAQLFLSARTVEWHMGKILTKLRIKSRRQLRQTIPE